MNKNEWINFKSNLVCTMNAFCYKKNGFNNNLWQVATIRNTRENVIVNMASTFNALQCVEIFRDTIIARFSTNREKHDKIMQNIGINLIQMKTVIEKCFVEVILLKIGILNMNCLNIERIWLNLTLKSKLRPLIIRLIGKRQMISFGLLSFENWFKIEFSK